MRIRCDLIRALPAVVGTTLLFLLPQLAPAQQSSSDNPQRADELLTSVRGPLQRRLAGAYPESFREGVDIFWEPSDGWVSNEVLSWWRSRLGSEYAAALTPEGAQRVFSEFFNESHVFPGAGKRAICAVVGPSRNLLESGYGDLIDAHDLVIRINRAPRDDFDSDVGVKTTHHVMWPRHLDPDQYDNRAFLLVTPVSSATINVFDRIIELARGFEWDPNRVRIIHPGFVKYIHENWTGERQQYPSTGFIALMLALHVCDEVDVFGFGADAAGRWDRYYEDDPVDVSQFHPGDYEGELRREMEARGLLKVFRGSRAELGVRDTAPGQDREVLGETE